MISLQEGEKKTLNIQEIKERLHHRYPFLLIDRVLELEEGKSCTALKNVSSNEAFFQGHFPDEPVMPGVLILEAMAQAAGIAGYHLDEEPGKNLMVFTGMDQVKFKNRVVPGDQLILKSSFAFKKFNFYGFKSEAYVNDRIVAEAKLKVALVPVRENK